jgi:endoglucanase
MDEKYGWVAGFGKPVVIVELGVTGTAEYQELWLQQLVDGLGNYPLLRSVIFFQAEDTLGAWGEKYGTPDWRLDVEVVERVIQNYELRSTT